MKVAGSLVRGTVGSMGSNKFVSGALALFGVIVLVGPAARAQAPYLLPYTIQSLAGGGTAPTVGQTCTSPVTGITGIAYDVDGDGCPITSSAVIVGATADVHDVVVDQEGNVYFVDNSTDGAVRRIDAHSGIITVYAGNLLASQPAVCALAALPAGAYDKYGDNCPATDGKANATAGYTAQLGKLRGLGVAKNGDVFLADYSNGVLHKISLATGVMSVVMGQLASATKLTSNGGVKTYSGDGGPGFNPLNAPTPEGAGEQAARGITRDLAGNIYVADSGDNVIRKITYSAANPLGIVSTIVGSSANAPSAATAATVPTAASPNAAPYLADGDGQAAGASTLLNVPEDVEVDAFGNIYIADMSDARIRVVYEGGTVAANLISKTNSGITPVVGDIYTIMGSGTPAFVASGAVAPQTTTNAGPVLATSPAVTLGSLRKLRLDSFGNLYVADNTNYVIWFLDASTGYMRVVAGELGLATATTYCAQTTDKFGDNCPATVATLNANSAMGVFVDSNENLYVTDPSDGRLRKVLTNQVFPAAVAGTPVTQTLQVHFAAGDSPASSKPFVITGSADFAISGTPTCNAGTNADKTQECLVTVIFKPSVAGADAAFLTVSSTSNGASAFALTGVGTAPAIAFDPGATSVVASTLSAPQGIAQDAAGNTYIADTGNNRVVEVAAGGALTVIAGTGTSGYTGDGAAATAATLNAPKAVAVTPSGLVFIADTGNNVVRQVNPVTGFISTVAGGATTAGCGTAASTANDPFGDGCPGTSATLSAPSGLAADIDGNVYVADTGNGLIRELTPSGYIFLYAGGATTVCTAGDTFGNGCTATNAIFKSPTALAFDVNRDLFVADTGNNLVREVVAATSLVKAIAGNGINGNSGNGGPATGAQLAGPTGVAVDAADNVYIADTGNSVLRVVNASGNISTVAGTLGSSGSGTVPGLATALLLASPSAVVSNGAGSLVILDSGNNRAVADARGSIAYNFGVTNPGTSSPTLQIQETNTGSVGVLLGNSTSLFTPAPSSTPFALAGTSTNGCSASTSTSFTPGAACLLQAGFNPSSTTLGPQSATFVEPTTPAITPAPSIALSGISAFVTATTSVTTITNPATGSPQYPVPFTVTTTVTPVTCNLAAPSCSPTGTITFFVGGVQVGLPVAVTATSGGATGSQTIPGQNVGTYAVTAVYSGDSYYAASSAASLAISVTVGATTTTVSASPATGPQFSPLTLTANVAPTSTVKTTSLPTGSVTFKAVSGGTTTTLGTTGLSATTGVATLADIFIAATNTTPAHSPNSFGLPAGTYMLTASYTGDANYAASTSAVSTLVIQADSASFTVSLLPTTAGTAQGSSSTVTATITPTNTLSGTITFTCTNLPAHVTCTFGPPSTLAFTPVALVPTAQQIDITVFTDVPSGVTQTTSERITPGSLFRMNGGSAAMAAILGWPILLASFGTILAFRRRLRSNPGMMRLLSALALFGILIGGTAVMSGCSASSFTNEVTPTGTYTINFVAAGPGNVTVTTPFNFVVAKGATGQL